MIHIASTATSPLRFVHYDLTQDERMVPRELASVTIRGGANLPNKVLMTPKGAVTSIPDKDWEWLCKDVLFLKMVNDGFLTIIGDPREAEHAYRDLTAKDGCAPKTESDFARVKNNTDGFGIKVGRSVEEIVRPG
jgi:hypothetical protein